MSGMYRAPVFNQSAKAFDFAAEGIEFSGEGSVARMLAPIIQNAPGLRNYLASYKQSIVDPFVRSLEARELTRSGDDSRVAFDVGSYATFKMIYDVYQDTGAEVPDLGYGLPDVPSEAEAPLEEPETELIDVFYRGAEFQDAMPHVFAASLLLMEEGLSNFNVPPGTDLYTPLGKIEDPEAGWSQLHFMAGAAETALTIEQRAALQ